MKIDFKKIIGGILIFCSISLVFLIYAPMASAKDFSGLKWWTAKIIEETPHANINMKYPQFIGGNEVKELNKHIREIVFNVLSEDGNQVKEWITNKNEDCDVSHDKELLFCRVLLNSTYRVTSIVNNVVSIELVITDWTGGGNGNHDRIYATNWNLQKNLLLDKKDIFCAKEFPTGLSSLIANGVLNKWNGLDRNKFIEPSLESLEGDVNEELASSDVLLGYRGLSFVFQPYALLSGAAGIVRAPIPYSYLKGKICIGK